MEDKQELYRVGFAVLEAFLPEAGAVCRKILKLGPFLGAELLLLASRKFNSYLPSLGSKRRINISEALELAMENLSAKYRNCLLSPGELNGQPESQWLDQMIEFQRGMESLEGDRS